MTKHPFTIQQDATLADARRLMLEHEVRHLPVLDGSNLAGIVSQRDLHVIGTGAHVDLDGVRVEEVMTAQPFVVTSDAPLDDVVEIMAARKYGSVIVVGHDGVEGIFTAVDVCRVLVDVLRKDYEHAELHVSG